MGEIDRGELPLGVNVGDEADHFISNTHTWTEKKNGFTKASDKRML